MDKSGQKIQEKSVEIVTDFMMNKFSFGDAMATLSIALINIAKTQGVDRKTFVENMGKDWDRLAEHKTTH
jgi:hypothetical protein